VRFIDTNVLLYLISTDTKEATKQRIAAELLESVDLALSVQVLQEFYVQATRTRAAARGSLAHAQAALLIESFLRFPVQEMTVSVLQAALETRQRFGVSLWDATIIEAARSLGCSTLLSEDLAHGQSYGSVKVENPFR
jgi:predicted nucleic acid-binding protein